MRRAIRSVRSIMLCLWWFNGRCPLAYTPLHLHPCWVVQGSGLRVQGWVSASVAGQEAGLRERGSGIVIHSWCLVQVQVQGSLALIRIIAIKCFGIVLCFYVIKTLPQSSTQFLDCDLTEGLGRFNRRSNFECIVCYVYLFIHVVVFGFMLVSI
jgi:hypothetical protein